MPSDQVLLTGATGHLGFRILRYALEYGYNVRAAVRSEQKAELLKSHHLIKPFATQLSHVIVPDILADGAYNEAIRDVKYVIHVASPLSDSAKDDDYERSLIQPAVRGTVNILEAAQKQGNQVRRVVITSSIVAISPMSALAPPPQGQTPRRIHANDRLADEHGPFDNNFAAYHASKVAALNATEAFVKKNNSSFDLVHVHPSFIEGRNDLVTDLEGFKSGTNRFMVQFALGEKNPDGFVFSTNHVDDSALIHVKALDVAKVPAQSYIVSNSGDEGKGWNDAREVIKKRYAQAVKDGVYSLEGNVPSFAPLIDLGDTEKVLGAKLKPFEEQVTSVLDHYLEVYNKENSK